MVGEAFDVAQAVRRNQHSALAVLHGFEQFAEDLLLGDGIEAGGRFVENQNFGPARQRQQQAQLGFRAERQRGYPVARRPRWNAFISAAQ